MAEMTRDPNDEERIADNPDREEIGVGDDFDEDDEFDEDVDDDTDEEQA